MSQSVSGAWHRWRSSTVFIVASMTIAISSDLFLYSFVIPILPYILKVRVGLPNSQIQLASSNLLAFYGAAMVVLSPICASLAERFPNRKRPLLIALTAQLIATAFSAASKTLPLLYLGRLVQGVSASLIWSVGMATVSDTVGTKHLGKTFGIIYPFITAGNFIGPMVGGMLLSAAGYWPAWSAALGVCVLDIITRLLMKEKRVISPAAEQSPPNSSQSHPSSPTLTASSATPFLSPASSTTPLKENTPLLQSTPLSPTLNHSSSPPTSKALTDLQLYIHLHSHPRIMSTLILTFLNALIIASFDATLPLHVQRAFNWSSDRAGLMFLALLGPGILVSPFLGWMRDNVGLRWPTAAAFFIESLCLVGMGLAGAYHHNKYQQPHPASSWPWDFLRPASMAGGKQLYVFSAAILSLAMEVPSGIASLEGSRVIDALEASKPGILGPHGGYSRLYGLTSMWYTAGSMVGPVVGGGLVLWVGYGVMMNVLAVLCFISVFLSIVFVGERASEKVDDDNEATASDDQGRRAKPNSQDAEQVRNRIFG